MLVDKLLLCPERFEVTSNVVSKANKRSHRNNISHPPPHKNDNNVSMFVLCRYCCCCSRNGSNNANLFTTLCARKNSGFQVYNNDMVQKHCCLSMHRCRKEVHTPLMKPIASALKLKSCVTICKTHANGLRKCCSM